MKIERLRKNHKKQIIIGAVVICIVGGALSFNLTKAKYKLTESIPLVRGTVNYKVPDLRTVALYTNNNGTYQETNDIPTSGYVLNKTKSVCKVYDGTTRVEDAPVDSSITIEYKEGKVNFLGISKRNTRCYLYFDKQTTVSETLIANSTKGNGTPDFSKTSCTSGCEEATVGTYTISDGMYGGTSTYWRGNTTDNYVKFAGFCWRIVRINGDGSIRLIYDGTTCHANGTLTTESIAVSSVKYHSSANQSNYVGWTYTGTYQRPIDNTMSTSSDAKTQLEIWYSTNIIANNSAVASKVADGKYCNDRNVGSGSTWAINGSKNFSYAAYQRLKTDNQPTLSCSSGDVYTLKVGLITADEVAYAGGKFGVNKSFYLYNGQQYWTMTPYEWYESGNGAYMFILHGNGNFYAGDVINNRGLRPVINLRSDLTFFGGNGTQSNPYIVQ